MVRFCCNNISYQVVILSNFTHSVTKGITEQFCNITKLKMNNQAMKKGELFSKIQLYERPATSPLIGNQIRWEFSSYSDQSILFQSVPHFQIAMKNRQEFLFRVCGASPSSKRFM